MTQREREKERTNIKKKEGNLYIYNSKRFKNIDKNNNVCNNLYLNDNKYVQIRKST